MFSFTQAQVFETKLEANQESTESVNYIYWLVLSISSLISRRRFSTDPSSDGG